MDPASPQDAFRDSWGQYCFYNNTKRLCALFNDFCTDGQKHRWGNLWHRHQGSSSGTKIYHQPLYSSLPHSQTHSSLMMLLTLSTLLTLHRWASFNTVWGSWEAHKRHFCCTPKRDGDHEGKLLWQRSCDLSQALFVVNGIPFLHEKNGFKKIWLSILGYLADIFLKINPVSLSL